MKICFVMHYCYPLFNPKVRHVFGGSETRAYLLAKELVRRPGVEVSFVVYDHGQKPVEVYDGIRVYRNPGRILRETFHVNAHRLVFGVFQALKERKMPPASDFILMPFFLVFLVAKKLFPTLLASSGVVVDPETKLLQKIDADLYATFGVTDFAQEFFAKVASIGKRTVLFAGSDFDFSETYTPTSQIMNPYCSRGDRCYQAIQAADAIVVQTDRQLTLLAERFGRKGTVVRNVIDLSSASPSKPSLAQRPYALWVGKSDNTKRPQRLLELARLCPDIKFYMVMNMSNQDLFREIVLSKPSNVELIEQVPFAEMDQLFSRSWILINTSEFEGFPNTFLQAAKAGTPILSWYVDPDQFIAREKCGKVVEGEVEIAKDFLLHLRRNESEWMELSKSLSTYVQKNHDLARNVSLLKTTLDKVQLRSDRTAFNPSSQDVNLVGNQAES